MEIDPVTGLIGLGVAAFVAGTLAPMQSEVVFVALIYAETAPVWQIMVVACVANTLGSVVNWWMGRFLEYYRHFRWFPIKESALARAQVWWARWGVWSLLLSWAPGGGWITVISGVMRTPFWLFTVLVAIAKTARYFVVYGLMRLI
ncbi:MAG: DedA family protein [Rhodobacteraceae bacterium]|nr:MAG: DedA family protein [Paracoccaceae bacterium]